MNLKFLILSSLITSTAVAVPPPQGFDPVPLLNAIQKVETGGCENPSEAVGDGGRAIGPLQIHRAYWQDAVEFDPSIGGKYEDCKDLAYARRVVVAYWTRYAPNWSSETLSRVHNGGPKGHRKAGTVKYWGKVRRNLVEN